eukprot:Pgem_evm1s4011
MYKTRHMKKSERYSQDITIKGDLHASAKAVKFTVQISISKFHTRIVWLNTTTLNITVCQTTTIP